MTRDEQKRLDDQLCESAVEGRAADVLFLLKAGANPNAEGGRPLSIAAYHGRLDIVKILLDAGANATLKPHGDNTAAQYAKERGHHEIVEILTASKRVETPDEIIFQRPLSDRTLEEIFNFVSLERISLVRQSKYGAVEAITYTSFENINDQSMLRKAFEEHVKRGGKADEAVIFPHKLPKCKLTREG